MDMFTHLIQVVHGFFLLIESRNADMFTHLIQVVYAKPVKTEIWILQVAPLVLL